MAIRNNLPVYVLSTLLMIGVVITNVLANSLPINGMTTKQVSDLYPSMFTPEGFTFSICGVIYLALICFVVYAFFHR
jgi:benzodiazapine receptor